MAITFTGNLDVRFQGFLNNPPDIGSLGQSIDYRQSYTLANGTGAGQANMLWSDTRTINASSSEDLDLAGGLTNVFGSTITFTAIKGIMIKAASGNSNNVLVGGDANGFIGWVSDATDIIVVKPDGIFLLYDPSAGGYSVTGGTGDILQIANSGAGSSITYDIILWGEV